MKKPTLNFGEFKQYDKIFITADNGVDVENVLSVAFDGDILYIAQPDCIIEYAACHQVFSVEHHGLYL